MNMNNDEKCDHYICVDELGSFACYSCRCQFNKVSLKAYLKKQHGDLWKPEYESLLEKQKMVRNKKDNLKNPTILEYDELTYNGKSRIITRVYYE